MGLLKNVHRGEQRGCQKSEKSEAEEASEKKDSGRNAKHSLGARGLGGRKEMRSPGGDGEGVSEKKKEEKVSRIQDNQEITRFGKTGIIFLQW